MPKSKTRQRPAGPPRTPRTMPAPTPQGALSAATLALYQASLQVVQEAELHILRAARDGGGAEHELDVHHHLRTGALGLLIAYSKLEGLPDPREQVPST